MTARKTASRAPAVARCARACRQARAHWPRLTHFVLPLVFPNRCSLCGNLSRASLCVSCDAAYWNEPRLRCTVCAVPLSRAFRTADQSHAKSHTASHAAARYRCSACTQSPPAFDATLALADYRAPLDLLALGLKFRARLALGEEFARRLARLAHDSFDAQGMPDLVVPVPLSRERMIERGYNQAWLIARPLAQHLNARAEATLVRRVLHTAPQSKLDRDTRRRNVGRAFVLDPALECAVQGAHVGVVDDVMTSGATLDALAHTLKAAGARRVTNFVALRTPKD
ncbi:ComF family protein [Paraburkholderia acidisoli]|uniref:ComF family protein n=1 Tax=Paraburkholderia acidisoli TaxID=2571748 RepID=UPI0038993C95